MTDKYFFRFRFPFSSFFKNDFTVTFCYISKLNWTYVQCGILKRNHLQRCLNCKQLLCVLITITVQARKCKYTV